MKLIEKLIKQSNIQELKNSLEEVVDQLERIIGEDITEEDSDLRSMFENTIKSMEKGQSQIRNQMKNGKTAREIRDLIIESWKEDEDNPSEHDIETEIMDKMRSQVKFDQGVLEDHDETKRSDQQKLREMFKRRMVELGTENINNVKYQPDVLSNVFEIKKEDGTLDVDQLENLLFGDDTESDDMVNEHVDEKNRHEEDWPKSNELGLDFGELNMKTRHNAKTETYSQNHYPNPGSFGVGRPETPTKQDDKTGESRKHSHQNNEWSNPKKAFDRRRYKDQRSEMDEAKDFLNSNKTEDDPHAKDRDHRGLTDALLPLIKSGALVSASRVDSGDVILEVRDTYRDPNRGWTSGTKEIRVSVNESGDITFSN